MKPSGRSGWLAATLLTGLCAPAFLLGLGCKTSPPKTPAVAIKPETVPELVAYSPEDAAAFVGNDRCANCHLEQHRAHRRSRHALTLIEADPAETRARAAGAPTLRDKESKTSYRLVSSKQGVALEAAGPSGKSLGALQVLIGSGKRGASYLAIDEGRMVELRMSYFKGRKPHWNYTPGQEARSATNHPLGRKMVPEAAVGCFLCHSSAVVRGPDGNPDLKRSHMGVGCESCHGPGRAHAEAYEQGRKAAITNPAYSTAEAMSRLCNRCHRSEQELNAPELVTVGEIARSPAFALSLSACFQESKGKMTCLTCHDPHRDSEPANGSYYVKRCLGCHTAGQPEQKPCPVNPKSGCVPCHMPFETAKGTADYKFATHDIAVYGR